MQPNPTVGNPFNREQVITACVQTILGIITARKIEMDKELAKYLKPHRKYWLFGPHVQRTHEEAESCIDNFTHLCNEAMCGRQEANTRLILLAARALTADVIWLTTSEFSDIAENYHNNAI